MRLPVHSIIILGMALLLWQQPVEAPAVADGVVLHIRLADEAITPVTARRIEQAIEAAQERGARALVIEMDTPGGLMTSTQDIVKRFLSSRVPIVVYIAPPGSRGASAGVFITLAGHVAAMAPGTHIGAAHPVSIGGAPGPAPGSGEEGDAQQDRPSVMEEKVVNDARAWARSLAEMRDRNAEWAELSVSESRSITATEALELNVIDLIAANLDDLLVQIDGRKVDVAGQEVVLETSDVVLETLEMGWGERLLGVISNPNVAFLLLMLGFYGILFEFYTPGWGVGGTIGVICLVLGFFGLAVLPVNYAGLALVFLGLGMFVAEAFIHSFGLLTVGGMVCVVLGGVMLIDSPIPTLRISLNLLIPLALATGTIAFFLVGNVVRVMRTRPQTGMETMVGSTGIVQATFQAEEGTYVGMVFTHGELWRAVSNKPLAAGQEVRIEDRDGLTLTVGG